VLDEDEFAKTLIPELFKHNNYASFVRQLNMYGFHKRVGLSDNSMRASEKKNKSPSEYYNPYFKRGYPNLLWLINKPKGGNAKNPKGRKVKDEDGQQDDSDEDGRDGVEQTYGQGYGNNIQGSSRALSAAPESGPLQRREIAVVQKELADIQKNQAAITQAITRLRKDHNQLYQQAVAFQTLHDRHESSINAILTFLATVYDRSLNGGQNSPNNLAQMFTNGIPQDPQQQQGNVVDIGDLPTQQQQNPGNLSPHRRQQRLLMAPPNGGRASTISPASTPHIQNYQQNTPRPREIEELFDNNSPSDSAHLKVEPETPRNDAQQNMMMNIINNTNAQSAADNKQFEFPEMVSQYENADGNSPLTAQQRNTMLNMIASQTSAAGSNNALVTPNPPQYPGMDALAYTDDELARLAQLQQDLSGRIDRVNKDLAPLSPTGSIPGLDHGSYFNGDNISDPANSNLDLDQYLETGAFYNGSSPMAGNGDYNFDAYGGDTGMGESHFDLGMDGANDGGRIIETAGSSEVNTPEGDVEDVKQNGLGSPSKRRRKN
jgi:heat shock transcription factor